MLEQEARIYRNSEYSRVYKQGRRWVGKYLIVFSLPNLKPYNRFGIVTSKKIGNAVARNRAKRQLREILRNHRDELVPGYDLVIVARYNIKEAIFDRLAKDMLQLLKKACK
jgi:ribonuclease P protein component